MDQGADALVPLTLPAGEVRTLRLGEEEALAIGTAPGGYTVLIAPADWALLRRWKHTHLCIMRGAVYAQDIAGGRRHAARFITQASAAQAVVHRNGNPFDIRRANLVVLSCSSLKNAKRPDAPEADAATRRDGSKWPRGLVPSSKRLLEALHD